MLCTDSPLCPFSESQEDCSPRIPKESRRPVYVRGFFSFSADDFLLFVKTSDICLRDDFRTLLFPVITVPDVIEIISFSDLLNRLISALQFCCPIRNSHVLLQCIILSCVLCKNKNPQASILRVEKLRISTLFHQNEPKVASVFFSMHNNHEKLRINTL